MKKTDLHWLAGIIEGEGCFSNSLGSGSIKPRIQVQSADLDVLEKLKLIYDAPIGGPFKTRAKHHSPMYCWNVNGERARELIGIIRPLMSKRRQGQIDHSLSKCHQKVIGSKKKCAFKGCPKRFIARSPTHKFCKEHRP